MTRPVLLLHGLWMRGFSLVPLASRLRAAGFDCRRFEYLTVAGTPERACERLAQRIGRIDGGCDLVAHSLGGLIALETLRRHPELPVERVVCLGSPLRGSGTAAAIAHWSLGPRLLGGSRDLLERGVPDWQGRAAVAVIAGDRPVGLGRFAHRIVPPHDGTVRVDETRLPGIAAHHVMPTTHTGMLFSAPVAAAVMAFLRDGRFADGC